jgi:hypothetical protein
VLEVLREGIVNRDLDDLLSAVAAFEALTPDQQAHHRHLQRISFAIGNVAMEHPEELRIAIERAAGPCPCSACAVVT